MICTKHPGTKRCGMQGRAILLFALLFAIDIRLCASSIIAVNPNPINFGNQVISSSAHITVTLTNGTTGKIKIVSVSSSLAEFSYLGPRLPVTLQPGQSMKGTLTFIPTMARTFDGTLTFTRSNRLVTALPLRGVGIEPTAVPTAPSVSTQPASQTITAGQTATFSVTASGTAPLSYQWNKNGAAIAGATSPSYTTPAETTADNGAQFTVVVSNSAGSITSNAANLTVNPAPVAPSITTQPANQTITAGQTATFSVTATGTAPLSYQWQKNGQPSVEQPGLVTPPLRRPIRTTERSSPSWSAIRRAA